MTEDKVTFGFRRVTSAEKKKIAEAMTTIGPWLDGLAARTKGVTFLMYVFSQGCSRKENFLYRLD